MLSIIPERPGSTDAPENNKSHKSTSKIFGFDMNGIGKATAILKLAIARIDWAALTSLKPPK